MHRPSSGRTPRQEHQVGRFLGVFEERLARGANLCAHGQTTSKINDLARADGYGTVGRDFSSADPIAETIFHHRCRAGGRVLQELAGTNEIAVYYP